MHASPEMEAYFAGLEAKLKEAIGVANEARAKGIDPRTKVEIPVANDLADRVEAARVGGWMIRVHGESNGSRGG